MGNADNVLFDNDSRVAPLGLIAMAGASELGKKVDGYLTKWANENEFVKDTFLVEAVCPRFSSGDGKGLIKSSIRGDDLFILCDVGNYSCTYNYFGREETTENLLTVQLLFRSFSLWAFQISLLLTLTIQEYRMLFHSWVLTT